MSDDETIPITRRYRAAVALKSAIDLAKTKRVTNTKSNYRCYKVLPSVLEHTPSVLTIFKGIVYFDSATSAYWMYSGHEILIEEILKQEARIMLDPHQD